MADFEELGASVVATDRKEFDGSLDGADGQVVDGSLVVAGVTEVVNAEVGIAEGVNVGTRDFDDGLKVTLVVGE